MSPRPKTARSVAAEIERSYRSSIRQLEESMIGLEVGCRGWLDRVLAIAKLNQSHREELVSRGLIPANLGNSQKTVYSFTATIAEQPASLDEERARFEQDLNDEYPDSIQAPPVPAVKKKKRSNQ